MRNGELPGLYTPIPQNMTDSESEDEFHLQINNCPANGSQMIARNLSSSVHTTIGFFNSDRGMNMNDAPLPEVRFSNAQSNYCNVGEDRPYISMSNHCLMPSDADNVAILNSNLQKSQPMSSMRKCCFIVSIIACFLMVILFIWVLPCSDSQSCPAKSERIHTQNWLRSYERVELKGTINVVRGIRGRSMNLVFMYRGNFLAYDDGITSGTISKRNGIISLMGSSGQIGWYDEMKHEPSIIDCNIIDCDRSGDADCLVIDEFGEMGCINPVSGLKIWHVAEKTSNSPEKLNFPLILPDINQDYVNDLLIACTVSSKNRTYNALKLISGATGLAIGQYYIFKNCSYIHKFQIESRLKISFNCIFNDTDVRISKSLHELYSLITNQSLNLSENVDGSSISQHKFYGQRKDTFRQRNIYSVNGKQLIVENNGVCPDSCNVTVTLLEEHNGKPKVIRNFNNTRMYGMVPARLSFSNSNDVSKSSVHGFVIKFWEWSSNDTEKVHSLEKSPILNNNINNTKFNRFDNILRKKRSWSLPAHQMDAMRTPSAGKKQSKEKNVASTLSDKINLAVLASQMRLIKETVVLIVFNSTDIRIENTSQSNIVQFCRSDSKGNEMCQPDLNYQENSVLIADLDRDGSQELVSYYY